MNNTREKLQKEKQKLLERLKSDEEIDEVLQKIYKEVDEILEKFKEKEEDDIIEE